MYGKYVIQRVEDDKFVARSGEAHSYTKDILKAQLFTREGAERGRCENERAVPLSHFFGE